MATTLTETAIQAAVRRARDSGKRVEISDGGLPGLRLRVAVTGGRRWVLACRDPSGRMRRFTVGEHPTVGLAQAREAARKLRVEVRQGADPTADAKAKRQAARDAREGIGTLDALLTLYGRRHGSTLKTWPEYERRIRNVFRGQLDVPLGSLTASHLQLAADSHKSAHSAAAAVRYLRPIMKWASAVGRRYVAKELVEIVPSASVKRRDRVLTSDELARLLPILRESDRPYAAALRFMLLTLARREEVGRATWSDINFEQQTWTILQTKNGLSHVVPLSRQAMALLLARHHDGCGPSEFVFATTKGSPLGNWDRETKLLQAASRTSGWTRHDLRRTGATLLGEFGELPDIIEAALNHVAIRSRLAATYNKSRYRPAVAAALQRLGDILDVMESPAANVIPLLSGTSSEKNRDVA